MGLCYDSFMTRLPFLTTFLIFILILTFQLHKNDADERHRNEEFWERERKANFTRKRDIENLPYVHFNAASIPAHRELQDERINEYLSELNELSGSRILNCTGKSNTDLKLEYGAANITKLTEYDGNYTILVRNLARLAEKYLLHAAALLPDVSSDSGSEMDTETLKQYNTLRSDAKELLEYGISINTDVRLNYELLASLYLEDGNFAAIENLREKANALNSLSRQPILRSLDRLTGV